MYVPSNSPKYVCRACRNKIPIADLDAIFTEEIKAFAYSSEQITAYLKSADNEVADKQQLLNVQRAELEKVRREIDQTYKLYQANKLDTEGFGKFYKPLDERQKQLEADIPRLEAEIDIAKVNKLSSEQVAFEAQDLSLHWPSLPVDDKRSIVEAITERITIGKGEITINLCCLPPSKDMAKGWRKGWFMRPFCHLVIRAIRVDSHPLIQKGILLSQALTAYRTRLDLTQSACAFLLRVSKRTLENWERGRTKPTKKLWANLKSVIKTDTVGFTTQRNSNVVATNSNRPLE